MLLTVPDILKAHPLPALPTGEPFVLTPMQREDIETLIVADRPGGFLPVGYGKTVVSTLVSLAWGDDHVLVIVPPILVPQWVAWLNSVGNSGGAIGYSADEEARKLGPAKRKALPLGNYRFWVMSYGIYRNDIKYLQDQLALSANGTYTTIVDEAQNLKNVNSVLFDTVNRSAAGRHLLLLTGTEMNNPGDAYAYIKLKTPEVYRSKAHFENVHVLERDFFENPIRWQNLEDLHRNLYLKSAHRTKEEVHRHLPQARYTPFEYNLHPLHRKFYDDLAEKMLLETEAEGKIDGTTPGKLRNALQQLIISWADFAENPAYGPLNEECRPAFYDFLDGVMDEIDVQDTHSSKLIVWTWFKRSSRNITAYLNDIGVPALAAYSEVDSGRNVIKFMKDPAWRVLVAQPGSAGAGLNPQYICWEAVFAELPTRSIPFRQSAGRIDREGQRFNPNIRMPLARGTMQVQLFHDLLRNDGEVQRVANNIHDLRKMVYSREAPALQGSLKKL